MTRRPSCHAARASGGGGTRHPQDPDIAQHRPPHHSPDHPLAERRKTEIRLEITRAAVRLFTTNGVVATTAEESAAAEGHLGTHPVAPLPNKESCVLPLLTAAQEAAAQGPRA